MFMFSLVIAAILTRENAKGEPAGKKTVKKTRVFTERVPVNFWIRYYILNHYDPSENQPKIKSFYRKRDFDPAWFDADRLTSPAKKYIDLISDAMIDGLLPDDYFYHDILFRLDRLRNTTDVVQNHTGLVAEIDLMITRSFLRYVHDIQSGKENLDHHGNMLTTLREPDYTEILSAVMNGKDVKDLLSSLRPQNPQYSLLSAVLGRLRAMAATGTWPGIPFTENIYPGDTSGIVPLIRKRLRRTGDLNVDNMPANKRIYDRRLMVGVEHFQQRMGLTVDGIIGQTTVADLNKSPAQMIEKVRVNLDRIRHIPVLRNTRSIVVNLPDYTLSYYEGGRLAGKMKVIIGDLENNTPMLDDSMEYIVFSPKWKVPEKIAKEELLPKIKRDTGYLKIHHYRLYQGKERIFPSSVDWGKTDSMHFPYRIEQEPGPYNALGRIKFIFPNNRSIYLHDTPSAYLFDRKQRHFSHGCVRIEKPKELAEWLLNDHQPDLTDSLDSYMNRDEPEIVYLKHKVPVYFVYSTAWVDDRGKLNLRDDIYGLDRKADKQLRTIYPETSYPDAFVQKNDKPLIESGDVRIGNGKE